MNSNLKQSLNKCLNTLQIISPYKKSIFCFLVISLGILITEQNKNNNIVEQIFIIKNKNNQLQNKLIAQNIELENLSKNHRTLLLEAVSLWHRSGFPVFNIKERLGPIEGPLEFSDNFDENKTNESSDLLISDLKNTIKELDHLIDKRVALLRRTPSINPAPGAVKTSHYGHREHPLYGNLQLHTGLDLAGNRGNPIVAPADGKVVFVGERGGYGKTIIIDHGDGLQTHYAHLNNYDVEVGELIKRNQKIAAMGSSGTATGPHLHYEVRKFGKPLNPINFIWN